MPPKYKLTYFNFTALGEPIRYLFSYGKITFEDNRIDFGEFHKYKEGTPYGKLPYLEIDGKLVTQSSAICRHLARKLGLAGKSDWDAILVDAFVDTFIDYRSYLAAIFLERDESKKPDRVAECKDKNTYYLSRFEKVVQENGGHFVNGQLTWADFYFSTTAETFCNFLQDPTLLDEYPNLKTLKDKVDNLPGIKEYRLSRPLAVF